MTGAALKRELKAAGTPERAAGAARYFKTGKGEYGEGDVFIGISAPVLRKIEARYWTLSLDELQMLLEAKEHEVRIAALEILVHQHKRGAEKLRRQILKLYMRNTRFINNWDLVDCSCREIVGGHLKTGSRTLLTRLAKSKSLWERRIAMVSTMALVWTRCAWRRYCSTIGTISFTKLWVGCCANWETRTAQCCWAFSENTTNACRGRRYGTRSSIFPRLSGRRS